MHIPKVISFTGLSGAGKTAAASYLSGDIVAGKRVVRWSFATPLKEMCCRAFPWLSPTHFVGTQDEKNATIPGLAVSGRKILQHIGTDGFRAMDPEIWVKRAAFEIEHAAADIGLVIFDDVRFHNEAVMVSQFGPIYRIVRPGLIAMTHASEQEVVTMGVTADIQNDGSLEDLYAKLDSLRR